MNWIFVIYNDILLRHLVGSGLRIFFQRYFCCVWLCVFKERKQHVFLLTNIFYGHVAAAGPVIVHSVFHYPLRTLNNYALHYQIHITFLLCRSGFRISYHCHSTIPFALNFVVNNPFFNTCHDIFKERLVSKLHSL